MALFCPWSRPRSWIFVMHNAFLCQFKVYQPDWNISLHYSNICRPTLACVQLQFICFFLRLRFSPSWDHCTLKYPYALLRTGSPWRVFCLYVCFDHRLFTPVSTPKGVDFCIHGCLYSRLKGSHAPSLGRSRRWKGQSRREPQTKWKLLAQNIQKKIFLEDGHTSFTKDLLASQHVVFVSVPDYF